MVDPTCKRSAEGNYELIHLADPVEWMMYGAIRPEPDALCRKGGLQMAVP